VEPLRDSSGRPVAIEIEVRTPCAPQALSPCPWDFPDPRQSDKHGFIGQGGDFEPSTIVAAYIRGIFPWPHTDAEYLWFSPDPRAVIAIDGLHVPRRLGRTIRAGGFRASIDGAFEEVMTRCGGEREGGTWITPALIDGYTRLHALGWAHSVEVWDAQGTLAGGLYGVGVGAMFGAESMFHSQTDASKVAMVALLQHARAIGIELIDVQVLTPHTARMGAIEIARDEYLDRLAHAVGRRIDWRR